MSRKGKQLGYDAALSNDYLESEEDLVLRLGFKIHDAARLRRIVIDDLFKPLKVTRSQAWVMAYLSRRDGVPQTDLADEMGLGKVTLGGLIDRLQDVGMVERRADASDRRVKRIHLTPEGRRVIKEMRVITLNENKEMLAGISVDEVRSCVEVLRKLNVNLNKMKNKVH